MFCFFLLGDGASLHVVTSVKGNYGHKRLGGQAESAEPGVGVEVGLSFGFKTSKPTDICGLNNFLKTLKNS